MKIYSDHLPTIAVRYSKLGIGVLIAFCAAILAGCGGGGGGGGSSSGGTTSGSGYQTFSGTVTNSITNVAAAGYTVRFDASGPSVTTSSTGAFSLLVPGSDITGNDLIYVIDQTNTVQAMSSPLTNDSAGLTNIAVTIGPPPAPAVPLSRQQ